jgi:hypothetical protein
MNPAFDILLPFLADGNTSLPESPAISQPLLRAVLLGALWTFALAILIGLPVKHFFGDLWSRKTSQPYVDDAGPHH